MRELAVARRGRRRESAEVIEEPDHIPTAPDGYPSWLDYAVETMDTRSAALEWLFEEDVAPSRDAMLEAARAELKILRRLAGQGGSLPAGEQR